MENEIAQLKSLLERKDREIRQKMAEITDLNVQIARHEWSRTEGSSGTAGGSGLPGDRDVDITGHPEVKKLMEQI